MSNPQVRARQVIPLPGHGEVAGPEASRLAPPWRSEPGRTALGLRPHNPQPPQRDGVEQRPNRHLETRLKALELFASCGFSRVSMRDLASHVGISTASIYNHIESKEALLGELIEELYEQLLRLARQVAHSRASPGARLRKLLESHLRLHEGMGGHFCLAEYDLHCLSHEQRQRILELRRRYETRLATAVEAITGKPASASQRAALGGIVSLLNQLPIWLKDAGVERALLLDMAMGALCGALGSTRSEAGLAG